MLSCGLSVGTTQLQAMFDVLDLDKSGAVSFRELNRALRRNPAQEAANAAERRRRRELAALNAAGEKLVDLKKLREEKQREAKLVEQRIEDEDNEIKGHAMERQDPVQRWRWAKREQARRDEERRRAFIKDSLHLRLRLRGTELVPEQQLGGMVGLTKAETPSHSRAPTRHCRLPVVPPPLSTAPKAVDVLSLHWRSRHAPARRHCHVLLPPITAPKRSKSEMRLLAIAPERMTLCYSTKSRLRIRPERRMVLGSARAVTSSNSEAVLVRDASQRGPSVVTGGGLLAGSQSVPGLHDV